MLSVHLSLLFSILRLLKLYDKRMKIIRLTIFSTRTSAAYYIICIYNLYITVSVRYILYYACHILIKSYIYITSLIFHIQVLGIRCGTLGENTSAHVRCTNVQYIYTYIITYGHKSVRFLLNTQWQINDAVFLRGLPSVHGCVKTSRTPKILHYYNNLFYKIRVKLFSCSTNRQMMAVFLSLLH